MTVPDPLLANLERLGARILAARARGAHAAAAVDLVVVTKSAPVGLFARLAAAGVVNVGENRVQVAAARRPAAPVGLVWHGIGHLQRNKAERAVELFDVFHALDSPRLAQRLDSVLARTSRRWPVYIEVNAADDPAKDGVRPEEALGFVATVTAHPHLHLCGFMGMARVDADEGQARETFRTLRAIRDEALRRGRGAAPPSGLSMGMTDDFEWAVEEGATVVRIGRAVFEGLQVEEPGAAEERA